MDPTPDVALRLADVGQLVTHGDDAFEVGAVHMRKRVEHDRLGHERTVLDYQIIGYAQPAEWAGDEGIVGDLL